MFLPEHEPPKKPTIIDFTKLTMPTFKSINEDLAAFMCDPWRCTPEVLEELIGEAKSKIKDFDLTTFIRELAEGNAAVLDNLQLSPLMQRFKPLQWWGPDIRHVLIQNPIKETI